jgi:hypothetical protein
MAIRLPSHLHRARSGILHFRIAIPPDLRIHFKTSEIYRSLRTANVREAATMAQALSHALKQLFSQIRTENMSEQKKSPPGPLGGLDLGLIMEFHFDTAAPTKKTVRFQTEPHDTPEMVSAALAAINGTAGAVTQERQRSATLFSELIEDYKRDRLAAGKWTPKT